ncbi:MAG: efflux RND transporter periplasmic adaptor subunit [Candidatus Coatesbacteria bacterium]|nr:efflux RND transporter periplasmic adaptor subunit [Candidatus Coatesbacteria bacterium]
MKKKLLIIAIILMISAVGYYLLKGTGDGDSQQESQSTPFKVKRGPIKLEIESTGRVVSNLDVEIKCKASGEVVGVFCDVSDPVKKGDVLVELDPVDEERRVKQEEVNLSSSKAKLAQAEVNLQTDEQSLANDFAKAESAIKSSRAKYQDARAKAERTQKLLESKRVSIEENETAQTSASVALADLENAKIALAELQIQREALEIQRQNVALAKDQVQSNEIELEIAQQRLKETTVHAPIDGIVSDRQVQVGQIVSSPTSNVGGGSTLLVLSDLSRIFVLAAVDESDIGRISVGQRVIITADAFPNEEFRGEVVRVAAMGESNSNVVTFDVKIEVLSEKKTKLKPEMTANVVIVAADDRNALLIPSDAVQRRRDKAFVSIPSAGEEPERREIEVGIDDGEWTQVLSGLAEGDEILTQNGKLKSRWSRQQDSRGRPPMPPMIPMGGRRR